MSTPPAGTTKKRLFSRNDYLAPLPIPISEIPSDVLNTIWRKNEVFLDIGNYSIGSAVMVLWPMVMLFLGLAFAFRNIALDLSVFTLVGGGIIIGIPTLFLIQGLFRDVPLPVRFNRQRREVCVPREDGEYWIVPWESVTAASTQQSSVSQAGKATMGLLIVGFENPDPQAKDDNKHFWFGFNCGGSTTAMALWECMRSIPPVRTVRRIAASLGEGILCTAHRTAHIRISVDSRVGRRHQLVTTDVIALCCHNISATRFE
ncbi:hypothetical protein [Pseudomonas yamanorum]